MIGMAYVDKNGYVIVKDKNGQEIGKFPLPQSGAKIQKYTDTEITIELESGMLIVHDENGKQLDSSLPCYKF